MDTAGVDARPVLHHVGFFAARPQRVTLGVVAVLCFVMPLGIFLTHHFHYSDFLAYYIAGRDALGIGADMGESMPPFTMRREVFFVPRVDGGFIAYRYSPFFLFLFTPIALLPYKPACIVFAVLNALAVTGFFALCDSWAGRHGKTAPWWVMPAVVCMMALHVRREVLIGNVNVMLLTLCLLAWRWREHAVFAGPVLAVIATTKPSFLIVTVPFWRTRHFLRWFVVGALCVLVLPLLLYGFDFGLDLTQRWIQNTLLFAGHPYVLAHRDSILSVWGQFKAQHDNWLSLVFLALYVAFVGTATALAYRRRWGKDEHASRVFLLWLACMPLMASNDSQAYVSVAPLMFYTLASTTQAEWPRRAWLLLVIGIFGHWFDMGDLYGKTGVHLLRTHGALGMAQMALITWCMLATAGRVPAPCR